MRVFITYRPKNIRISAIAALISMLTTIGTYVYAETNPTPAADSTNMLYKNDLKYQGSSTTIDPNYRYVMEELVDLLKTNPEATIHIRGHVCCGPNKRISFKRARNVFKHLVKEGINRARISFDGYSDDLPLAYPEKTEEDEIKNRRVDFVINFNS